MWAAAVVVAAITSGCGGSSGVVGGHGGPRVAPFGTTTTASAVSTTTVVPAMQTHNPKVAADPSKALRDGQVVAVSVSGFGAGSKVRFSECATSSAANLFGCGDQVASQPFVVTGDSESATTTFTVMVTASSKPYNTAATAHCRSACVLVASNGGGFAWTPLEFAYP